MEPKALVPFFPICKMNTIITFFTIYTKRIHAVFLKSTVRDGDLDLHALQTVRRKEEVREVSLVEGRVWGRP